MKIIKLIKPGLFIYECIRIVLLAFILYFQGGEGISAKVIFTAPGALYPLMAMFIWLDCGRYRVYVPLFTAGKCVGIFMMLGWSIITRQVTMIESFVLSVDFFSLAAVLMIRRNLKIQTARAASILNTVQISSPQIAPELEDK